MSEDFLKKLQNEAELQSRLEKKPLFPKKINSIINFIALYPWQFLTFLALLSAFVAVFI